MKTEKIEYRAPARRAARDGHHVRPVRHILLHVPIQKVVRTAHLIVMRGPSALLSTALIYFHINEQNITGLVVPTYVTLFSVRDHRAYALDESTKHTFHAQHT